MIEFLVPALGLAGLLPQLVGAMDDLFLGGIFHFSLSGWKARTGLRAIADWVSRTGSGRRGRDFVVRQGFRNRTRQGDGFGRRTWLMAWLPKLDFLGHGGDRIPDPADDGLQSIGRDPEPPGQGANVRRIAKVDFIAKRRMFDALHGGIP